MGLFNTSNMTHSKNTHPSPLAQQAAANAAWASSAIFWNPPVNEVNKEENDKEKKRLLEEFLKFSPDYREAYISSLKAKAVQDKMSPGSSISSVSNFVTIYGNKGTAITISIEELEDVHANVIIEGFLDE